jgi:hypothetical protein
VIDIIEAWEQDMVEEIRQGAPVEHRLIEVKVSGLGRLIVR